MKRLVRIIAMLGILALAGLGVAWRTGRIPLPGFLPTAWTRAAQAGPLVLYGNVDVRQVNLSFKVPGRIAALPVDEGDVVEPGQEIATLDPRYFDDAVALATARRDAKAAVLARLEHGSRPEEIAQAEALLAQRQAESARADVEARRTQRLLTQNSVSIQEYEQAWANAQVAQAQTASAREALQLARIGPRVEDIDAARADLAAADSELVQARRDRDDAHLYAPGRGVILTRAREVGAIVQPGEVVFALTLASPVWIRTYVGEPELGQLQPGTVVDVVTDSAPDRPYRGHVGYVSPTAEFTPKTVETAELRTRLVYRMRIVVDNPDGGLRQGMPVTVRIPRPARSKP
jgi:HlyD family secretion protein